MTTTGAHQFHHVGSGRHAGDASVCDAISAIIMQIENELFHLIIDARRQELAVRRRSAEGAVLAVVEGNVAAVLRQREGTRLPE